MDTFTEKTMFEGTVAVWALPLSEYDTRREEGQHWEFSLKAGATRPWQDGAVCVVEAHPVTVPIPGGIDLREKAVETLEAAIAEVKAEAYDKVAQLQRQIDDLLVLEAPSEAI